MCVASSVVNGWAVGWRHGGWGRGNEKIRARDGSAGTFRLVAKTVMSKPYLPQETVDYIIDLLRGERESLEQCCLVSKSWVPRTRKHLFAYIQLCSASNLESWKETFPDVANSPACHARGLLVGCPWLVEAADAEEGGWIQAFSGVKRFAVTVTGRDRYHRVLEVNLTPFHNFSPTLKSLDVGRILFQYPQLSDLIRSFPLLENLSMAGRHKTWFNNDDPHGPQILIPSASPALSGNLNFHVLRGAGKAARQLLDLPNGLHFRHISLSWDLGEDVWWGTELVALCSHSLKSLDMTRTFCCMSIRIWSTPIT